MNKKNLPHIPLYIGDWEKDCNVLSLESEAAWLRILFKMFSKGKQSTIKMPTKSLQNLWRCSAEKTQEILADLKYNEICEIQQEQGFVEFTSRRFKRENELSQIRSEARKSGYDKNKSQSNANQNKNKKPQNADIDNDNNNDNNSELEKGGVGEKTIPNEEEFLNYALSKKPTLDPESAKLKYEAWKQDGWMTGGEKPRKIKNWKTTLLNTIPHLKTLTVNTSKIDVIQRAHDSFKP